MWIARGWLNDAPLVRSVDPLENDWHLQRGNIASTIESKSILETTSFLELFANSTRSTIHAIHNFLKRSTCERCQWHSSYNTCLSPRPEDFGGNGVHLPSDSVSPLWPCSVPVWLRFCRNHTWEECFVIDSTRWLYIFFMYCTPVFVCIVTALTRSLGEQYLISQEDKAYWRISKMMSWILPIISISFSFLFKALSSRKYLFLKTK